MKRWFVLAVLLAAAAWMLLSAPSSPKGIDSAAELGLLLVDETEGVSVLGVKNSSLAEQAGIRPGDVLLCLNGVSLNNAEMLDYMLGEEETETFLIDLRRGKTFFSVRVP